MSLSITTGLFSLDDFTDCHAILGVGVEADAKTIRKRYLKVAQRLHPDSFATADGSEKDWATQLFSKLVSPAYNTLSKERERKEYLLLISLKGKQGLQQRVSFENFCAQAQQLATSQTLEEDYQRAVLELAEQQYDNLQQTATIIGKISELNLVYLMWRESSSRKAGAVGVTPAVSGDVPESTVAPETPEVKKVSHVDSYLRRAEDYLDKKAYAQAILELRDALNLDPKDSRCHSLMGIIYLQQNQLTMAKVSIKRSLELNPADKNALKAKIQLEKLGQSLDSSSRSSSATKSSSSARKPDTKGGSGLFGGLFGGKKK